MVPLLTSKPLGNTEHADSKEDADQCLLLAPTGDKSLVGSRRVNIAKNTLVRLPIFPAALPQHQPS